jgi:hypothetical protein
MRRVLDDQLHMNLTEPAGQDDPCIYCLLSHLTQELEHASRKKQDNMFALELLDFSYTEIVAAYEAAIYEVEKNAKEIHQLRDELESLRGGQNFQSGRKDLLE